MPLVVALVSTDTRQKPKSGSNTDVAARGHREHGTSPVVVGCWGQTGRCYQNEMLSDPHLAVISGLLVLGLCSLDRCIEGFHNKVLTLCSFPSSLLVLSGIRFPPIHSLLINVTGGVPEQKVVVKIGGAVIYNRLGSQSV